MIRNLASAAIATIQDYPSIAGGICAFGVAFALVAGNAIYSQPGGHPEPLWATRDLVTTRSVAPRPPKVEVRRVRTETVMPAQIPVPILRPEPLDAAPQREFTAADHVHGIQEGLKRLGHYDGDVDGLMGPQTRAAIMAYQKDRGFEPDGEITAALVEAIRANDAGERKIARAEMPADVRATTRDTVASVEPIAPDVTEQSSAEITKAAKVARIQIGLMNFGEAGIAVDGVLGPQTVVAIRSFQERYNLPITGEPDDSVIAKLEQIGALRKG